MRRRSILRQIILSASAAVLLFGGLWTSTAVFWLYSNALMDLEREADLQAKEMSAALAPLVWNLDDQSIQNYLDTKAENREFLTIEVHDPGGHRWSPNPGPSGDVRVPGQAPITARQAPVVYSGQEIGTLKLEMTLVQRMKQVAESILTLLGSLLFLFLAILTSLTFSWRRVALRLQAMVEAMEGFSSREGEVQMAAERNDELGILAQGFNTMADRIRASTRSMEQEIQERTERLMESEKLALVGSLVAGVAHEINTPIGNGITVTSWLAVRTKEIRAARAAALTEEEWETYLADVESSLSILQSGLDRTSNLIQTFKRIGADQVVDERRILDLRDFLTEVTTSLQPTLKRFPHRIIVECPEDFSVENHPGALFQIVTNLVLNAHHHAFAPDEEGCITLSAFKGPDREHLFQVSVQDDGVGIPENLQTQIFQPFFTTKRLEGGTGLGLSIVRNLVQNLGGFIEVTSAPSKGSTFTVTLPQKAPKRG